MTATATKFEIGQKVTNERGAWVRLRMYQHPSNFYFVYGYEYWAADFAVDLDYAESTTNLDRAKVERQMRNWLKNR